MDNYYVGNQNKGHKNVEFQKFEMWNNLEIEEGDRDRIETKITIKHTIQSYDSFLIYMIKIIWEDLNKNDENVAS